MNGGKWQEIRMARFNTSIQDGGKKRGRPLKKRLTDVERERIKQEIVDCYKDSYKETKKDPLPSFYDEVFTEASKPEYRGYRQPCDSDTVKDAFVHFFSGSRPLPNLYRRLLTELTGIALIDPDGFASPEKTEILLENPTQFLLTTKDKMPQRADFLELNLGGGLLKSLTCKMETQSPYFRFGFKLLDKHNRLFGDGSISSQDANLLVHIGRNNFSRENIGIYAKDIFSTWYWNGISTEPDKKLFPASRRFVASCELSIDSNFCLTLSVNRICCLRHIITPAICRRVAVLAWGDREEFAVEVSELSVKAV